LRFDLERGERMDCKCIKYGFGEKGQWSNKGIPLSSYTKGCVFEERSPLSGAVEETMKRQIAHKEWREMWKGGAVSIKAVEGIIDKGRRVTIGGGGATKRL
jgi:hypothetical protein